MSPYPSPYIQSEGSSGFHCGQGVKRASHSHLATKGMQTLKTGDQVVTNLTRPLLLSQDQVVTKQWPTNSLYD